MLNSLEYNLRKILENLYFEHIPGDVQKIIHPLVIRTYLFLRRIYLLVFDIFPPIILYRGNRNSGNPDLNLLVSGREQISPLFLDRMYAAKPEADKQRRYPIWKIPFIDKSDVHATLIEADQCFSRFLSKRGFFAIPDWILFTIDISKPLEEILRILNKTQTNNFRKIRKYQYTFEMVQDKEKLHFFYHKMYIPHIKERFGRLTHLTSLGAMEAILKRGELLLVKRESEYISGALIYTATLPPILSYLGVKDGRRDYVQQGAIAAIYYFIILWGKERGYSKLDFGHCRAMLNDGVFRHKKRWGMRVQKSPRKFRNLYLSIHKSNSILNQFLIENPLVYNDRGQLKGLLFFQNNVQFTGGDIEAIKKRNSMPGLEGFEVVFLGDKKKLNFQPTS